MLSYFQVIEVKNTHPDSVKMLIMDQLPLSSEEKIKVCFYLMFYFQIIKPGDCKSDKLLEKEEFSFFPWNT